MGPAAGAAVFWARPDCPWSALIFHGSWAGCQTLFRLLLAPEKSVMLARLRLLGYVRAGMDCIIRIVSPDPACSVSVGLWGRFVSASGLDRSELCRIVK